MISNVFDHLAIKGKLGIIQAPDAPNSNFHDCVYQYVRDLETLTRNLHSRIGVLTAFTTPPGLQQWSTTLQQFVYAVYEVCQARRLNFGICGSNIRVDQNTLRPTRLSYPAVIAEMSKLLQSVHNAENCLQLTIDDTTAFDFGMEIAKETFDRGGVRRLREPTDAEVISIRGEMWYEKHDPSQDPTKP